MYWLTHVVAPLVIGVPAIWWFETRGFDKAVADYTFDPAINNFPWRNHWFAKYVVHDGGKIAVIVFGVVIVGLLVASRWKPKLADWRIPLAYMIACLATGPLISSGWKDLSDKRCPWDLKIYGGFADHDRILETDPPDHRRGCFPCGQASSGFALMGLYFALKRRSRRWSRRGLVIGLVYGTALGVGRIAQGAHYPSHVVATALVCWFSALILYELFLRRAEEERARALAGGAAAS